MLSSRFIISAGIAAAFIVGFLAAKIGVSIQNNIAINQSQRNINKVRIPSTPSILKEESWLATKKQLINRWNASPSVHCDFPLQEETYALLAKAPISELEEWMLELNANSASDEEWDHNLRMQSKILSVLAQRSPEQLIQFLERHSTDVWYFSAEHGVSSWIDHDPLAALHWLEKSDLPEEIKEDIVYYIENAIIKLSVTNPVEFEKRLARIDSELRESILQDYAYQVGIASGRAAILDRAASSEKAEAMALWKGLLRRESEINPEKSYATLNQLPISEADRMTLDLELVEWILTYNPAITDHGAEFMRTWLERNPQRSVPSVMVESYIEWFRSDSQQASDWVAKRLPDHRYDTFAKRVIEQRIYESEEDYPLFAKLADQITDSSARTASLRLVKNSWHSKNPTAASEWQSSLTAEDQEALK